MGTGVPARGVCTELLALDGECEGGIASRANDGRRSSASLSSFGSCSSKCSSAPEGEGVTGGMAGSLCAAAAASNFNLSVC